MKSYKFKINNSDFTVDITGAEDNIIELEVNGTPFKVEMEKAVKAAPKTPKVVNASVAQNAKTQPVSSSAVSKVEAPLPGVILSVNVKEGDTVKSGDTLMVMEAMKMENGRSGRRGKSSESKTAGLRTSGRHPGRNRVRT